MNNNSNNDNNGSNPFSMKPLGKALDTPVDERSGDWASSTLSALGPTIGTATTSPPAYPSKMTTHPTMPATHTLGSGSASTSETGSGTPAYSHKFPSPKPVDGVTAADAAKEFEPSSSSSIFPDAFKTAIPDTTSAFSDTLPPPIPRKNNPFVESQAPTFDTERDPGVHFTSTTNAAPAAHNPVEVTSASTATTPGLHIPGAYPGMEKERMTDGDLAMAKAATAVALERAKELALATGETMMDVVDTVLPAVKAYMPSTQTTKDAAVNAGQAAANAGVAAGQAVGNTAANTASNISEARPVDTTKSYLASAGDVIRNYVPASVSAYLPGSTQPASTLPSQEIGQNIHPASSDGVGTLPGPPGEIGVAVLPDERTSGNLKDTHKHSTHPGGVGTLPGDASESGVAVLPEERNRAMLPSAQAGLGLPGATDEAGVAVLPIERGAGNEHALMEKDAHRALVSAVPGAEHYDAVDVEGAKSTGNGSVAFVEPPFESATNVYTNSPPPSSSSSSNSQSASASDSLLSPKPISNAASTLNGASADASIRSLAGSKNDRPSEQNSNPITTTTNSVPHPEPTSMPNHTAVSSPGVTAAAVPVTLVGAGVDPAAATKNGAVSTAQPVDGRTKLHREELAHHQDSTTATQGHGSPFTATDSTNSHPESASTAAHSTVNGADSHGKSASTSSGSSMGKKPSLFSKMKGEMKVLSGKIGHNEEKIEEGRRMMGKTLN